MFGSRTTQDGSLEASTDRLVSLPLILRHGGCVRSTSREQQADGKRHEQQDSWQVYPRSRPQSQLYRPLAFSFHASPLPIRPNRPDSRSLARTSGNLSGPERPDLDPHSSAKANRSNGNSFPKILHTRTPYCGASEHELRKPVLLPSLTLASTTRLIDQRVRKLSAGAL